MEKLATMAEKRANALSGRTIAFVGSGAMAGAMIGGLLNSHTVDAMTITASDPHQDRTQELEKRFGVATSTGPKAQQLPVKRQEGCVHAAA